jgi:hypothetical protein
VATGNGHAENVPRRYHIVTRYNYLTRRGRQKSQTACPHAATSAAAGVVTVLNVKGMADAKTTNEYGLNSAIPDMGRRGAVGRNHEKG